MEKKIEKSLNIPIGYHQKVKQYLEKNSTGDPFRGNGFDSYSLKGGGKATIVDVKNVLSSINMSEKVENGLLKIIGSK